MRNAIKSSFPGLKVLRCWKHLTASIKRYLHNTLNLKKCVIQDYVSSIYELHHQPTEDSLTNFITLCYNRAQILIDLNQIKFDEEFDIYKIKEDNKDTRIVSKRENLFFCICILVLLKQHVATL